MFHRCTSCTVASITSMESKQKKNKAGDRSKLYSQEQEKGIMIDAWCFPQSNTKKNALVEQFKKENFEHVEF